MSQPISSLKMYSTEDFLSSESVHYANQTVTEVFCGMLGLDVEIVLPPVTVDPTQPNERTAIVGFSGSMRGSCELQMSTPAAQAIASAMLGGTAVDDEGMIDDAVGELCNMLAGGWKDRVPTLSSDCALSPPTVISGREYKVRMTKPSVRVSCTYRFDEHAVYLTLHREEAVAVGTMVVPAERNA